MKAFRADAAVQQNDQCFYCDAPMWGDDPITFGAMHGISSDRLWGFQCTTEHLIARSDGGSSVRQNIAAACRLCNQVRHELTPPPSPSDFRSFVQEKIAAQQWEQYRMRANNGRIVVKGRKRLNHLLADLDLEAD